MSSNLPKNFPGNAPVAGTAGASLPKNFQPGMAPSGERVASRPGPPEVTRAEIAEHFARRIIALRDQAKGTSSRPWLFVVEFPFNDFMRDVAAAYSQLTGAALQLDPDRGPAAPAQPLVTLGVNVELFVNYMNHGNDVSIFCPRAWMLPQSVREIVDAKLSTPRFDAEGFAAACADFYELAAPPFLGADSEWVASVVPRDFLLSSQASADEVLSTVRRSMERRMARYSPDAALDIDDFSGMEEARLWAASLVEEIRLARAGRLPWSEIESGVALAGPRGVGKSSLARAIARAAGIRYVEVSASSWMATQQEPNLGIERLLSDFQEALSAAPAVFFIADLDVFGSMPWMSLTGPLLQHLQSLKGEPGLVIVGSVQTFGNLPLPLRQHGGLEATLTMSLPNSHALS
jgi:hypothetical protein